MRGLMVNIKDKAIHLRPPRVVLTYEWEGDPFNRELPFVIGVLADLSGHSEQRLPSLKDPKRTFVDIDRDNFDEVMKTIRPRLAYTVATKLTDDGSTSTIAVELKFD